MIPAAVAGTPLKVYVGGNTAGFEDFSDKVAARLPLFIGVVIGLSVLLLIAAFRSLWIPLVSAVFNLLSIGAAYGVVVAVFQEGIGASLIGADSGVPVVSFIPVMLFAILFGLSMDYNVFLLSRIHEAYNEGDGPRESVIHGMARIGKVVLFAGLIMASVFLAFVTQPDIIGKMFGVGLGLAILIDVLIVRLVIAPAVVTLLGDRAWWLPGWLDRILPNVSLEGHLVQGLDTPDAEADPAACPPIRVVPARSRVTLATRRAGARLGWRRARRGPVGQGEGCVPSRAATRPPRRDHERAPASRWCRALATYRCRRHGGACCRSHRRVARTGRLLVAASQLARAARARPRRATRRQARKRSAQEAPARRADVQGSATSQRAVAARPQLTRRAPSRTRGRRA